jgi:hypothetical protein
MSILNNQAVLCSNPSMRVSKLILAFICVLISALLVRAAISATMPISMMGKSAAVAVAAAVNEEHAPKAMDGDCPGHRAAASADAAGDATSSNAGASSCAWCGECCVSAPVFTFDPDQNIVKTAPQVVFARIAVPRLAYLTPGLYRPPAA